MHRSDGLLRLFKGVHVQVIRAVPTSATGIVVFEGVRDALRSVT